MEYAKKAHLDQYAKKGIHGGSKIVTGFRDFLLRGNVVGWLTQSSSESRGSHYPHFWSWSFLLRVTHCVDQIHTVAVMMDTAMHKICIETVTIWLWRVPAVLRCQSHALHPEITSGAPRTCLSHPESPEHAPAAQIDLTGVTVVLQILMILSCVHHLCR